MPSTVLRLKLDHKQVAQWVLPGNRDTFNVDDTNWIYPQEMGARKVSGEAAWNNWDNNYVLCVTGNLDSSYHDSWYCDDEPMSPP